ncbi:hypothetical protein [Dyadobacter fermentans]|uniref:hypothetical protein n=1 Tax=Dyadobacter fermentans TaxID=94254 RepID=UPI001CBDE828|nr:hypothetical protein [Dyadobacter fermentans]MBZ1361319.1 hypothetical protein [Dyadobacter fermentans]
MKIVNRYLSGLYELFSRLGNPDPELGVMGFVILFEGLFLVCLTLSLGLSVPKMELLGNKWLGRLLIGVGAWLLNKYVFGIRESVYREYKAFSQISTIVITMAFFAIILGFLLSSPYLK